MQIKPLTDPVTFDEFCAQNGITLVAQERPSSYNLPRWYVSASQMVEIRSGGVLRSTHGNGDTPEEAKADYATELAGHRLLIGGYGGFEVQTPNEWLEP